MAAAASPDGRFIAIDLVGAIWILPISGGAATKITPDLFEARQPTWSPDGNTIAFQGYDDGAWHVYTIARSGGEPKALTSGVFDDREPAWSHDGSRIAFSSDRVGGITTIWTVNIASREIKRIRRRSTPPVAGLWQAPTRRSCLTVLDCTSNSKPTCTPA